jgi:hypothetical protein
VKNYINLDLVMEREVSDEDVEELNKLHFIMDCVVHCHNNTVLKIDEDFREIVEYLEYRMQRKWGFPEMQQFHTHFMRLRSPKVETRNG